MGADVLAALTIAATYNEMTLLVQKMTDLVLKRNASDGNLDKAMDTAEDIKQCLGRMKLVEEETARLKNAEMSKVLFMNHMLPGLGRILTNMSTRKTPRPSTREGPSPASSKNTVSTTTRKSASPSPTATKRPLPRTIASPPRTTRAHRRFTVCAAYRLLV